MNAAVVVGTAGVWLGFPTLIAERARHAMLHAVPKLTSVTVHVDPSAQADYRAELAHHDRASATR